MKLLLREILDYLRTAGVGLFWAAAIFLIIDLPPVAKLVVLALVLNRVTRQIIIQETIRVISLLRTEVRHIVIVEEHVSE